MKQNVRNCELMHKEKQQFLENEIINNKDYDERIKAAERMSGKVQTEYIECEKQLNQFRSDVSIISNMKTTYYM